MMTHTFRQRIGLLFLPVFLVGAFAAMPNIAAADQADDEYELALGLYKQKRWDLATDTFRKYLKAYPKHEKASFAELYLGQSLVNLRKYKEARSVLRDFIVNHPKDKNVSQAMYRVGECSYFLDDYKATIEELNAFIKLAPKDPLNEWALPYLADAYFKQKDAKSAAKVFEYSLKEFPNGRMKNDCLFGLAKTYEQLKETDKALALYKQIAADPKNSRAPQAQMNIGMQLFDDRKFEDASLAFDEFAKSFPKHSLVNLAQLNSGYAQYYLKDYNAAIDRFAQASTSPNYADQANYWTAVSFKSLQEYAKASEVLEALTESTKNPNVKQQALYQWADSELRREKFVNARQLYVLYADAYPKTPRAEDSLRRATEAALLESNSEVGLKIADRFEVEFPQSKQLDEIRLLKSRLLILNETPESLNKAATLLTALSAKEQEANAASDATFHLARVQQKLNQHEKVVGTLKPLVAVPEGQQPKIPAAFAVQAISLLELDRFVEASASAEKFIELSPESTQQQQMLSIVAIAEASSNNAKKSLAAVKRLATDFADDISTAAILQQVAETAYERKNWDFAATAFEQLMSVSDDEVVQTAGLSGLGWSQYEASKFEDAAATFGKLRANFAKRPAVASDAAHLQGLALKKAGQVEKAAEVFTKGYEDFATTENGIAGQAGYNAYLCAKEAARAYRDLGKVEPANDAYQAAYNELTQQPVNKRQNLDKLLDEWGLLHYEAEDYDRADEIFRILIAETPNSDRADDARLTLAESDFAAANFEKAGKVFASLANDPKADEVVQRRALYQLVSLLSATEDWPALEKACLQYLAKFKEPNPKFPQADFAGEISYRLAEALAAQNKNQPSHDVLLKLMAKINEELAGRPAPETVSEWIPGVWLLAAETSRELKKYDRVATYSSQFDGLFLKNPRRNDMQVIVGRSQIAQAKLAEARKTFDAVLASVGTRKSEAAAQSLFFKAETELMEKKHAEALKDYLRVYHLYDGYEQWQSAALFQAGQCDEVLGNTKNAIESYRDLVAQFPESQFAASAKKRLKALSGES